MKYALALKPLVRDSAGRYSGASPMIGSEVMGLPTTVISDVKFCGGSVVYFHVLVWYEIQNIEELIVFPGSRDQCDVLGQSSGGYCRV